MPLSTLLHNRKFEFAYNEQYRAEKGFMSSEKQKSE